MLVSQPLPTTDEPTPQQSEACSELPDSRRPARLQFRLWHLFALTTYFAAVAGLVRWKGVETLPASLGLGIAWLNCAEAFAPLQKGKRQAIVLSIAWVTFLISLFLPAFWNVPGWYAAWFVLLTPVDYFGENGWDRITHTVWWIPFVDAANLLQVLLPLTIWRLARRKGTRLVAIECIAMVSVWTIAGREYEAGYFVWCASFLLALVAFRLNRRQLVAMHIMLFGQLACRLLLGS